MLYLFNFASVDEVVRVVSNEMHLANYAHVLVGDALYDRSVNTVHT